MAEGSPGSRGSGAGTADPRSDAQRLAFDLRSAIDGEVRFDPGSRHLYATDASNFRQVPIGVVLPRSVDDVVRTVEICRTHGAPITHRGGGTSLAGQACNAAVIIDHSRHLDAIGRVDVGEHLVQVEPGVVLDDLRDRLRPHGLTWGPDPSTHNRCTVGGMIGNNACGMHAFRYGRVQDNVRELDVLLYDGTRMTVGPTSTGELDERIAAGGRPGRVHAQLAALRDRYEQAIRTGFPDIPRRVSGFNLPELLGGEGDEGPHLARALVGTEGTCVTVLGATLELNPEPAASRLLVLGYPEVCAAGDHITAIRDHGRAVAVEGMDGALSERLRAAGNPPGRYLPEGGAWLLVELGGDCPEEADAHAHELVERLAGEAGAPTARIYTEPAAEQAVWAARKSALAATARFGDRRPWPGWEDPAVAPADVGDYLRDFRRLLDDYGLTATIYGHFGDGCIHSRIDFDLSGPDGVAAYRAFLRDAAEMCADYGGSLSGEHGDGQQRGRLLEIMYGPELVRAFREFKAIFDPDGRMNPGKVVDAAGPDEHLRVHRPERQWHPDTVFAYPEDGGFNAAQLRCVGIGTCRRDDGAGTMCPSYMVTHEERHSTRGRARLLFEMLQPDSELDGWRDESVREALELCLSCKGCKSDCPTGVDLATYKAEFNHHHWAGRVRPRSHYALGLIDVWLRLAAHAPGLVNRVLSTPRLGAWLRRLAGLTGDRPAPRLATRTFREWFRARPATGGAAAGEVPGVVLFPDTFVNHFHPEVGRATVAVLEDAGYRVRLPPPGLCCGRPLYDLGMLDRAQRYLDRLVDTLSGPVAGGLSVVGMEPSCVAVLRDELLQLRPDDPAARRLAAATMTLDEFLVEEADYQPPPLHREAIVHGHCHRKGALGTPAAGRLLDRLGLDWRELDAGCCGLAGGFGFQAGDAFDVSVRAGERRLLPAVRDAADATLIISDGFSCRTQIRHLQQLNGTGGAPRGALHVAQVLRMAAQQGPDGPPSTAEVVEDGWVERGPPAPRTRSR